MSVPFGTGTTEIAGSWFVVGPGCNRTIGGLGFTKKKSIKKLGLFIKFDPEKGSRARQNAKMAKTRVAVFAVFAFSYSYPYASLCLL